MRADKTSFVRLRDGETMAFTRAAGTGRQLLFLHGLGDDRHVWDPTIERLAHCGFDCIAADFRGHGESSYDGDFDPFGLMEDVCDVIRELRLERPILVGHSLGGFVATAVAQSASVSAVINVDQMLRLSMLSGFAREHADELRAGAHQEVMIEILRLVGVDRIPEAQREALLARRHTVPRKVVLGVWRRLLECSDHDLETLVAERLRLRGTPYIALHGSDPGPDYEQWLRSLVDDADVVVWDGVGHYPQVVELEDFVDLVQSFARRV